MSASMNSARAYMRAAEQNCRKRGFVKCGANWYRLHGQGLLQVVTFNGIPERTTDASFSYKPTVAFVVYSMYDHIPWINFPVSRARRDVIPNIMAGVFASKAADASFLGPDSEAVYMNELVFPFLDEMITHNQLADLLEAADRWKGGRVRMNDRNKLIPYLLSGKLPEVVGTINAIEVQNQQAYLLNCKTVKSYDPIAQKQKMKAELAPLISLRENILSQNEQGIIDLLLSDYHKNICRLEEMAIPVPAQYKCGNDLLDVISFTTTTN